MAQHRVMEQLNLAAHQNAITNSDPFVLEAFLTFDAMGTLVHELLAVETWRQFVYPKLKATLATKNSMRGYFIVSMMQWRHTEVTGWLT